MTRDEYIEMVAFLLDCMRFFKQMEYKYRNTAIGLSAKQTLLNTKDEIKMLTRSYKKDFNESINIKILEELV